MPDLDAAERFVWTNARLLDRHRFALHFRDAPREPVLRALAAYANDDGGYGHGLEPDLRTPTSQPAAMETALQVLREAGALDAAPLAWLERVAPGGRVPFVLESAMTHPRAPWWQTDPDPPGSLTVTGLIAGTLHGAGVVHPWLDRASDWLWATIEGVTELSPYEALGSLAFLDAVPDEGRAVATLERLAPLVDPLVARDPGAPGEQQTAIDFSPRPGARSRALFDDALFDATLDQLAADQHDDGGWDVDFPAWSPGASVEWRGFVTVDALLRLREHGRLG